MITTTLGAIATAEFTGGETIYRIYVISSGDIPLYVGKSKDAVERVLSHLALGDWIGFYGSTFDEELREYEDWKDFGVTLFTCEEYETKSTNPLFEEYVSRFEDEMIYLLSPAYNQKERKQSRENVERWERLHPRSIIEMNHAD